MGFDHGVNFNWVSLSKANFTGEEALGILSTLARVAEAEVRRRSEETFFSRFFFGLGRKVADSLSSSSAPSQRSCSAFVRVAEELVHVGVRAADERRSDGRTAARRRNGHDEM